MSQNAEFHVKRAGERADTGDFDGYFEEMAKAIEFDPKNLAYRQERSDTAFFGDRYEIAIEDYSVLINETLDEEQLINLYNKRAVCYQQSGNIEKAIQDVNWLLEHGYDSGYAWRGKLRLTLEQYEDAIQDFDTCLEKAGKTVSECLFFRSIAYYRLGYFEEALEDLLQVYESYNGSHSVYDYHLAKVYYQLGDFDKSLEHFNEFAPVYRMDPLPDAHSYMKRLAPDEIVG